MRDTSVPFIDGISFDDMWKVPDPETRRILCARGLVWRTSLKDDGVDLGGTVFAKDREAAEAIADARGLGEVVEGPYIEAPDGSLPLSETAKILWRDIQDNESMEVPEELWPAAVELALKDFILLSRPEGKFRNAKVWRQN